MQYLKVLSPPSLRVPVTAQNRELLRRLRAAELSAWEAGRLMDESSIVPQSGTSETLCD